MHNDTDHFCTLSSKYSESEVEGIVTRARVAEVERERLLELTKMLQQRYCNSIVTTVTHNHHHVLIYIIMYYIGWIKQMMK